MRGLIFNLGLAILLVGVIVSSFYLVENVFAEPYTMDDYLKLNYNTYHCLERCEAQFDITNPTGSNIAISDSSKFNIDFFVAKGPNLKRYELLREEEEIYYVTIPDYGTCSREECADYNNATSKCLSYKKVEYACETGSHQEKRTRKVWKNFDPVGKTLKNGETWKMKLVGHKKPGLGENNIDWLLEFNGFKPDWAWWKSNWTKCRDITWTNNSFWDEPVGRRVTLTGLTGSNYTKEIRIVDQPCNMDGSEKPYTLIASGGDWADIFYDLDNSTDLTHSVYYDYSAATEPSYPDQVKANATDIIGDNYHAQFNTNDYVIGKYWNGDDANEDCWALGTVGLSSGTVSSTCTKVVDGPTFAQYECFDDGNWKITREFATNYMNQTLDTTLPEKYILYNYFMGGTTGQYYNDSTGTVQTLDNGEIATVSQGWYMQWKNSLGESFEVMWNDVSTTGMKYLVGANNVPSSYSGGIIGHTYSAPTWYYEGDRDVSVYVRRYPAKSDYPENHTYTSASSYPTFVDRQPTYTIGSEEFGDITAPTWVLGSNLTNISDSTKNGDTVYFNINFTDETAPGDYIFSFNDGEDSFSNDTAFPWTNNTAVEVIKTITAGRGDTVKWKWYFSDASGNWSVTPEWSIALANMLPTQDNPLLNTPTGKSLSTEELICLNQSTYDGDGDEVTNIFNWYKNDSSLMSLNMPFEINSDDYSGNNNNGTLTGTENYINGQYGKALDLDGSTHIKIDDDNTLDFTDTKTWQLWFKRDGTGVETLFDKSSTDSNYKLEFLSNNKLKFSYSITPGTGYYEWNVDDETDFDKGTYTQTDYNTTYNAVILTDYTGDYKSRVYNHSEKTLSFDTLTWSADIPELDELDAENNMVGLWHFNENTGTTAYDSAENNDGTIYGASWTSGKFNYALDFDGDYDYVSTSTNSFPTGNSDITIEAWFKIDDLNGDNAIVVYGKNSANNGIQLFYRTSDDKLVLHYWGGVGAVSTSINDNNWHHVVGMHANNNNSLYLDGEFKGSTSYSNANIINEFNEIGRVVGFPTYDFDGKIDEVAIWNRSLSSSEIQEHYEKGSFGSANLTMFARSCANSCSSESWTTLGSSPADISSLSDNKYFQFKADFETDDLDYSPKLYDVALDYSAEIVDVEANITSSAVTDTEWHLATVTFDDSAENNFKIYLDDSLENEKTEMDTPTNVTNHLYVGVNSGLSNYFDGTIDEFRIYSDALSFEQVQKHHDLDYNKLVSQETSGGDVFKCSVTPNDGIGDGTTKTSDTLTVLWNVTFLVTNGDTGEALSGMDIECDNGWSDDNIASTYEYGVSPGSYNCVFWDSDFDDYYNKTISFTASDQTIDVIMELKQQLTIQEHNWLKAIYDCLYNGNCKAMNLLIGINETTTDLWNEFKPTDQSVITSEVITNSVVNSTNNLTIEYTIDLPIKEGFKVMGGDNTEYLPVMLSYWFVDESVTTCYNQGDKPTGVESPYCKPLTVQTIGEKDTQITLTVEMRPDVPAGTYNIIRNLEIDPERQWLDYGQSIIGQITVTETGEAFISLKQTVPTAMSWLTGLNILNTLTTNMSLFISFVTLGLVGYLIIKINKKKTILISSFFLTIFIFILVNGLSQTYLNEDTVWGGNLTEMRKGCLTFGDIDNDGRDDLIIAGGDPGEGITTNVYINNGTTFLENTTWQQNLTGVIYSSMSLGDIDNDGDLDLALIGCSSGGGVSACNSYHAYVYINNGTTLEENNTWGWNLTGTEEGSVAFADINNDGKLDLALTGERSISHKVRIYINNGTSLEENLMWEENQMQVLRESSISFGDVNNDGWLDMVISGWDGTNKQTKIYTNNRTSLVENSTWGQNLLAVRDGSAIFGDYDNDGDLDLNLIGCCDRHRAYDNNGTTFVQVQTDTQSGGDLNGLFEGGIALGDYDNDGYLDMATIGRETRGKIYLYNGTPFTSALDDPESHILGLDWSSIAWNDIDNDNDLDLIISGKSGVTVYTNIYTNNITTPNTIPTAPNDFNSSYSNGVLTLQWTNGSDANTSSTGLYYNLRVGTSSEGNDIVSGVYGGTSAGAMSGGGAANGYFGNMMQRKRIELSPPNIQPNTTFYWSVQSIDTSLANSTWSTEQTTTTPIDTTKPTITLNSPVENYNTTNSTIIFNATAFDNKNLTNVSLYGSWGGWHSNQTNTTGANNTEYIFTVNLSGYPDAIYSWYIRAIDNDTNQNNSETRSFIFDTTKPEIKIISPVSSWTSSSTVTFTYNVSDVRIENCSLIIDNSIDQTDTSVTVNTQQTFTKSMTNADYTWYINCTDSLEFKNKSDTYSLTVSYTATSDSTSSSGGGGGILIEINKTENETIEETKSTEEIEEEITEKDKIIEEDMGEEISDKVEEGYEPLPTIPTYVPLLLMLMVFLFAYYLERPNQKKIYKKIKHKPHRKKIFK